jgi:hypothetical protein
VLYLYSTFVPCTAPLPCRVPSAMAKSAGERACLTGPSSVAIRTHGHEEISGNGSNVDEVVVGDIGRCKLIQSLRRGTSVEYGRSPISTSWQTAIKTAGRQVPRRPDRRSPALDEDSR